MKDINLNELNKQEIMNLIKMFIQDNYNHKQKIFDGDKTFLNDENNWYKEVVNPMVKLLNKCYHSNLLTEEHIYLLYWGHVRKNELEHPNKWVFLEFKIIKEIFELKHNNIRTSTYVQPYQIKKICYKCKKEFVAKIVDSRSELIYYYSWWNNLCSDCYNKEIELMMDHLCQKNESTNTKTTKNTVQKPVNNTEITNISESYNNMLNTLKYMPYEEYLQTEHWLHFRNEALKWSQNKCQLCEKTHNLNVHHKTYKNRGRETFNDIIVLCKDCHAKIHDKII